MFTKQTEGSDRYGRFKAFGAVNKSAGAFVLSTGGQSVEWVENFLHGQGYEQCTNHYGKELVL